jgi:hypothetical protein
LLFRLVLAELRYRPGRALFLLAGYSLGVAVMVVLLAVGEAMLEQSKDRALVGGGDIVLVPAGISPEMLRSGGSTSLYLGIDHARFVQRNVLESPRGKEDFGIAAASPVLDGKLVELTAHGRTVRATATGEIPSRARAAGALPVLLAGAWRDAPADLRWADPSPGELYRQLDHFHLPRGSAVGDSTWAEWHYFNVVLAPDRWVYLTFMVAGRVGEPGRWGGRILLTVRDADGAHRAVTRDFSDAAVRFDTTSADLHFGADDGVMQEGGVYRVNAALGAERLALTIHPSPHRYFPPTELGGRELVSGYTAPALSATAEGTVCLPGCEEVRGAQAYHDHNWGVWRDVSWEWGAASDSTTSLLYGVVRADTVAAEPALFAYVVDDRGVAGLFRPAAPRVEEWQDARIEGARLRVPRRFSFTDARRGMRTEVTVRAFHVSDTGRERRRFFVQMRGDADLVAPGLRPRRLTGFFETYVDPVAEGSATTPSASAESP